MSVRIKRVDDIEYESIVKNICKAQCDHQVVVYNLDPMTGFIRHPHGYCLVPKSIDKDLIKNKSYGYVKYRQIHSFNKGCIPTIDTETLDQSCVKCQTKLPFYDWYKIYSE
jgi:hypothetical protein